jgi:hypothetical protein
VYVCADVSSIAQEFIIKGDREEPTDAVEGGDEAIEEPEGAEGASTTGKAKGKGKGRTQLPLAVRPLQEQQQQQQQQQLRPRSRSPRRQPDVVLRIGEVQQAFLDNSRSGNTIASSMSRSSGSSITKSSGSSSSGCSIGCSVWWL